MATLSRVRRYVPTYGGNNTQSDGEQIVVFLKNVDVGLRQSHIRKFINTAPEKIVEMMMDAAGSKEIQTILFNNVVRIEGLIFEDNFDDPKIIDVGAPAPAITRAATIKDVWEQGEFGLCLELFTNILNASQLSKADEKNLGSPSGSTPTPPASAENVH